MDGVPSWAVNGTLVVCVEPLDFNGECIMIKGCVYTLDRIGLCPECGAPECIVKERDILAGHPAWMHLSRFRPLVTLEDDLKAHFIQYLNTPAPVTTKQREQA